MSQSRGRIPFSDTLIILTNKGEIQNTLNKKPSDDSPRLHAKGFHPINCKIGIIYSQTLRYRRIISNNDDFEYNLRCLLATLVTGGYNIVLINDILLRLVYCYRTALYNTFSKLPPTNYPLTYLSAGTPYILIKNYVAIGTLFKVMKVYKAYLQSHRSWPGR